MVIICRDELSGGKACKGLLPSAGGRLGKGSRLQAIPRSVCPSECCARHPQQASGSHAGECTGKHAYEDKVAALWQRRMLFLCAAGDFCCMQSCTAACCALLDCYVTAPQTHLAVLYCVCLTASSSRLSGQHFGLPPRALVASVVVWPHDLHRAYQWLSQEDLKSFTIFRSSMPLPSLVFQSSMPTSTISPAGNPLMMLRSVCKVSATWFSVSKSTVFLGDEAHAAFNAWFF